MDESLLPNKDALQSNERGKKPLSVIKLAVIMGCLISLGCVNFVLIKLLYTAYGDKYSFFVNQGVNFLYIVYGGCILYPQWFLMGVVTPEMRRVPKRRFVIMGFLDALGTFFTAMGAVFTPGSMQPMLNQTLIPWIMIISRVYLKKIYRVGELTGAGLILLGAITAAIPALLLEESDTEMRSYAVFFYALSNVPMAMSACYKEGSFQEVELNVWYLTQYVSIFQFLISFLFMPLLCLPGFGNVDGIPWSEVPVQFHGGWLCFMEATEECANKHTFSLLVGYCGINILYNTLGLYLVKEASALMNALSFAILLPCTTLMFFTPFAGLAQEHFSFYNWFTVVGLFMGLFGFAFYQRQGRAVHIPIEELDDEAKALPMIRQKSFQERIVGLDLGLDVAEARKTYGTEWQLVRQVGRDGQHGHKYRHAHGDLPPHWHNLEHKHKYDAEKDHGHGHDVEHKHDHGHSHGQQTLHEHSHGQQCCESGHERAGHGHDHGEQVGHGSHGH